MMMKVGFSLLLLGHLALVVASLLQGVLLRHLGQDRQGDTGGYRLSNMLALAAGLAGIITGISVMVMTMRECRSVVLFLLAVSLLSGLLAAASALSLAGTVGTVGMAITNGGESLRSSSRECHYNPTRIYGTTLTLWVPLLILCTVESFLSGRCFVTCVSSLNLPCPIRTKKEQMREKQRQKWAEPLEQTNDEDEEEAEEQELLSPKGQFRETSWV